MSSNFELPTNDIRTREVYLKGNLRVRRGDKLYIFGDTREMHLLDGYYYQDNFVGMSVWPDLRISQECLIEEENVRAVETADNSLYTRTVEGFFLKEQMLQTILEMKLFAILIMNKNMMKMRRKKMKLLLLRYIMEL